ncbi:GNAT family N-acetyltransferase [Niveispirillum cyanobacteriorum]|uniref:GNAT family N-acetyltransferase n=1 Tax=Niveispirillum cyanobacteriorum TaxID=1612173 RepID=A0A2K9NBY4_9PROT|nr:GNAT family N-acetyltransferase [Niveispirillum cyanobacteriorum]AUN30663.1 GNAT family N-acetyltransferase [Niveispirillum cyanobacteriorum]GGE52496.1 N-acetyltransferase [Niveispirillum cyanobacteriorum]
MSQPAFTPPPGGTAAAFGPPGLWLRARQLDDAAAMAAMASMPKFRHGTLRPPFPSVEGTRAWMEKGGADDLQVVAILEGKLVGSAGLFRLGGRRRHVADLAIGVHDDAQGMGVGKSLMHALIDAADRWLDLHRVELTVFADNDGAIRLYRHFGFVEEGRLRDYAFRDGVYIDALAMGRLRPKRV